ncbi:MAG: glutaminase [Thermodesulfobacteriota bacterium]
MNYQDVINEINEEIQPYLNQGKVATYIPELANIQINKFGMAVHTIDGNKYSVGDSEDKFSIQSISKLFTLTLAKQFEGEALWERIGREPSGNPFNSLVQLEYENGIPRNPFINAGAIVITDVLVSKLDEPKKNILDFIKVLSGTNDIGYNLDVARSEKETGYLNKALANFLKSFNNLENDPEQVLDVYFHQCSIAMSCVDLANACLYLANDGKSPNFEEVITTDTQTKYINSLLLTCGTYDSVGDFAYRVGLPGKSGVGGGIIAVMPDELSVCVWSPGLNESGNSLAGTKALELFTTMTGISVF